MKSLSLLPPNEIENESYTKKIEEENLNLFESENTKPESEFLNTDTIIFENKNSNEKKFKTFIDKADLKNFLCGGDFSDLFNFKQDDKNICNKNNKKFHTFTLSKQNSLSSQLNEIIENEDCDSSKNFEKNHLHTNNNKNNQIVKFKFNEDEILELKNDTNLNLKLNLFFNTNDKNPIYLDNNNSKKNSCENNEFLNDNKNFNYENINFINIKKEINKVDYLYNEKNKNNLNELNNFSLENKENDFLNERNDIFYFQKNKNTNLTQNNLFYSNKNNNLENKNNNLFSVTNKFNNEIINKDNQKNSLQFQEDYDKRSNMNTGKTRNLQGILEDTQEDNFNNINKQNLNENIFFESDYDRKSNLKNENNISDKNNIFNNIDNYSSNSIFELNNNNNSKFSKETKYSENILYKNFSENLNNKFYNNQKNLFNQKQENVFNKNKSEEFLFDLNQIDYNEDDKQIFLNKNEKISENYLHQIKTNLTIHKIKGLEDDSKFQKLDFIPKKALKAINEGNSDILQNEKFSSSSLSEIFKNKSIKNLENVNINNFNNNNNINNIFPFSSENKDTNINIYLNNNIYNNLSYNPQNLFKINQNNNFADSNLSNKINNLNINQSYIPLNSKNIPTNNNQITNYNIKYNYSNLAAQTINLKYANLSFSKFNNNPSINQREMLDKINELIIREIEIILNFTGKIEENLFQSVENNFINLIKSQNGSRVFQKFIKTTPIKVINLIYSSISLYLNDLIMDSYANYFCQKFFNCLDPERRLDFLLKVN